jgi:hypothetical protein
MTPTADVIREWLSYDPETGEFRWRQNNQRSRAWNTRYAGKVAGAARADGYVRLGIGGGRYLAHRIAWVWMTGGHPESHIDHINGNPSDNRFANLREATRSQNQQNRGLHARNSSGFAGVSWFRRHRKWRADIMHERKAFHLGRFDSPEDAHKAYLAAKARLHSFQPTLRGT